MDGRGVWQRATDGGLWWCRCGCRCVVEGWECRRVCEDAGEGGGEDGGEDGPVVTGRPRKRPEQQRGQGDDEAV